MSTTLMDGGVWAKTFFEKSQQFLNKKKKNFLFGSVYIYIIRFFKGNIIKNLQTNDQLAEKEPTESLSNLAAYCEASPPLGDWSSKNEALVYLKPDFRFQIKAEKNSQIAYGLDREDDLAKLGISGAELDSKNFAENLISEIRDHLSIRNLDHLLKAVDKELKEQLFERAKAIERFKI